MRIVTFTMIGTLLAGAALAQTPSTPAQPAMPRTPGTAAMPGGAPATGSMPSTPGTTAMPSTGAAPSTSTAMPSRPNMPTTADASEAAAKARCAGDTVVWENTATKVYHMAGTRYYGKTKKGAYACQKDADKAGYHAAKEKVPAAPASASTVKH